MGLSAELIESLRRLAPGGTPTDLVAELEGLLALASEAVPSCLAVSLELTVDAGPVVVTAVADGPIQPVLSSLALPLPQPKASAGGGAIVHSAVLLLFAGRAGSLEGMGRELIGLLDVDPRRAVWDGHLTLPSPPELAAALADFLRDRSSINQALGALLDRGLLPPQGRVELVRLAALRGISRAEAARRLLAELPPLGLAGSPSREFWNPDDPTDGSVAEGPA